MATFRGTVQGSRGTTSRLGHSNLATTCNGWSHGIRTYAVKRDDGTLCWEVWQTAGSNGGDVRLLGTLTDSGEWIAASK